MTESARPKSIAIAGAGYSGLHVAQRLGSWAGRVTTAQITLVDRHDYHQLLTELPQVAAGTRDDDAVRVRLSGVLPASVRFEQSEITGFDLGRRKLQTTKGDLDYWRLVLALGSRPNDFNIPGLAEHVIFMWAADDAVKVRSAVETSVKRAAAAQDPEERSRLLSVVIGGGGATGVELAGAFAEELPEMAAARGLPRELCRVVLVEAGHTILAGSSPELVSKALGILHQLGVHVLTNSIIVEAGPHGLRLKSGATVDGGAFIWAGGVKAPDLVQGAGFEVGYNGRIKVDQFLRALDREEIYVAGDLASVPDPETGMALAPLAQTALSEGDTVAENIAAEMEGRSLSSFRYRDKGFVVSVGGRRGVAEVAGLTLGGRLAHVLKEAIEWEYRQSVRHLRGWAA